MRQPCLLRNLRRLSQVLDDLFPVRTLGAIFADIALLVPGFQMVEGNVRNFLAAARNDSRAYGVALSSFDGMNTLWLIHFALPHE